MAFALTGISDAELSLTTAWGELQRGGAPATGQRLDISTEAASGTIYVYRGGDAHSDAEAGADSDTDKLSIPVGQCPISIPIDGCSRVLLAASTSLTASACIRG